MNSFETYHSCKYGSNISWMAFGGQQANCLNHDVRLEQHHSVTMNDKPIADWQYSQRIYINERCVDCPHYKKRKVEIKTNDR